MAQDLALHKNERLAVEHLKLFLAVTESFENDLKGIGQLDSKCPLRLAGGETKKKTGGHRYDELRLSFGAGCMSGVFLVSPCGRGVDE